VPVSTSSHLNGTNVYSHVFDVNGRIEIFADVSILVPFKQNVNRFGAIVKTFFTARVQYDDTLREK